MPMVNLKVATAAAVTLGALGLGAGATIIYLSEIELPEPENQKPPAARISPLAKSNATTDVCHGRVLDAAGKPLAGAKLLLLGVNGQPEELEASAADGRFTAIIPKDAKAQYLIALKDGAGMDVVQLGKVVPIDVGDLRLVKDQPIHGRIINTEGQPVAGAKVAVTQLSIFAGNSLDKFLAEWKNRQVETVLPKPVKNLVLDANSFLSAITGKVGQFTIAGTGVERFVELTILGEGIAESRLWVVNRAGFDAKPYNQAAEDYRAMMPLGIGPKYLMYGPDLALVAPIERRIRGVVKDIDTGKPRPGLKVWLSRDGNEILPVELMATTDANGRYEIRGAGKGTAYVLHVASDTAAGYLPCDVTLPDPPGYDPIAADIAVKKGVILSGRVLDTSLNKPLPGLVTVGVLAANTFVKDYPVFDNSSGIVPTADDGTFRIVTIPGEVLLMGGPDPKRIEEKELGTYKFKPARPDPKFPDYFTFQHDTTGYYRPKAAFSPLRGQFCKVLDIKPGAEVVSQDILLELATVLPIKLQTSDGRPVVSAWVTGMSALEAWQRPVQINSGNCAIYHLEPGKPRLMVFYAAKMKLIGTLSLKGDEKDSATAKLGLPGAVRGRLAGEDGKPLVGITITPIFRERSAEEANKFIRRTRSFVSDAKGRFEIEDVIPGPMFSLAFTLGRKGYQPLAKMGERTVSAGDTLDLGEVKLKPQPED